MNDEKWLRLNVGWADKEWVDSLPPESQLAWIKLLTYIKSHGVGSRGPRLSPVVAAKRWGVSAASVQAMESAALNQREPIRKPAPAETEFMPPRTFQVRHWESAIVIAMPPREFGDLTTYSRPMASAAARAAVEMLTTRLSLAQLEKMIGELPKERAA